LKSIFFSFTKELVLSFWSAVAFVSVYYLVTDKPLVTIDAIKLGCFVMMALLIISMIVSFILIHRIRKEDARISRILSEEGVTPEVLRYSLRKVESAEDRYEKAEAQLALASCLSEGGYYDRCFETLAEISFADLSETAREEYFNIYVYTNLFLGDLTAAQEIYERTYMFFDRAKQRCRPMAVLHTLGVLEYAKANYILAESYFLQAKAAANDRMSLCECEMFLSLCYMNTNRPEKAVSAAKEAAALSSTVYQRRYIEGLRRSLLLRIGGCERA